MRQTWCHLIICIYHFKLNRDSAGPGEYDVEKINLSKKKVLLTNSSKTTTAFGSCFCRSQLEMLNEDLRSDCDVVRYRAQAFGLVRRQKEIYRSETSSCQGQASTKPKFLLKKPILVWPPSSRQQHNAICRFSVLNMNLCFVLLRFAKTKLYGLQKQEIFRTHVDLTILINRQLCTHAHESMRSDTWQRQLRVALVLGYIELYSNIAVLSSVVQNTRTRPCVL